MDNRELNQRYTDVAKELIQSEKCLEYIRNSRAEIAFLSSGLEKKQGIRIVYGQCEKVPVKWRWSIPYDFAITIFEPNVEKFTPEQIKILLLHELLHVGIEVDGNEEKYSVNPHDIEDFREVIARFGIDWSENDEAGKT